MNVSYLRAADEHMELAEWLVYWAPKLASRVDAQIGHLYDACTSLPQKSQAAKKWLEIRKKKKKAKSQKQRCHALRYELNSTKVFNLLFFNLNRWAIHIEIF